MDVGHCGLGERPQSPIPRSLRLTVSPRERGPSIQRMLVQLTRHQPFGLDPEDLSEHRNLDRLSADGSSANARDWLPEALPSFVALFASGPLLVEKERRVASEACQRSVDDVPSVYQPGIGVPDWSFRLTPLGSEPSVH